MSGIVLKHPKMAACHHSFVDTRFFRLKTHPKPTLLHILISVAKKMRAKKGCCAYYNTPRRCSFEVVILVWTTLLVLLRECFMSGLY